MFYGFIWTINFNENNLSRCRRPAKLHEDRPIVRSLQVHGGMTFKELCLAERLVTVDEGFNMLAVNGKQGRRLQLWDGKAAERIVEILATELQD